MTLAKGDIRRLGDALGDWLGNYQISGAIGVVEGCYLSLGIEEWAWWAWLEADVSVSVAGGVAAGVSVFTVPGDERAWLDSLTIVRATGDNNLDYVRLIHPEGYRSGAVDLLRLLELTTPATGLYWPNTGGGQTVTLAQPGPMLLEPGSLIQLVTDGSGASASTFDYAIRMRRTKMVRAKAPYV